MRNSAISKSSQNAIGNKILVPEHIVKEEILQRQNFSKNHQIPNNNNQKSITDLFKKFRNSAQVKQLPQPLKQKASQKIFFEEPNSPLLKNLIKQETCFEPNSFDIEEHKENQKLELDSKKFIDFSKNNRLSVNRIKSQFNEQYHKNNHNAINKHIPTTESNNHQSFNFGHGLQGIDLDTQGQFDSTFPQKNSCFFVDQKGAKSFENTTSIFAPMRQMPSNISVGRKLPNRVREAQMRSTGKNFFRRPSSLTASQDFLKTSGSQNHKSDKREVANINTSINPFRENQSRGLTQIKRSSSQTRSMQNTFNAISQIISDNKYRGKKEGPHLSLANNLNRLLFKYNGGHATTLYNYRLKIKNQSSVRLSIKIKCTSPRSYEVRPSTETILNPSEIFSVSIQLKLFTHDLNQTTMKHDLSRYRADKFKIIYWTTDHATQEDYFDGQKVLPVVIEMTEEQKARNIGFEQNRSNQKMKQTTEEKEIQMYKKLIEKNKQKVQEVDSKISILNSKEFKHKYFSKHLFWVFALFGMMLGFWLG